MRATHSAANPAAASGRPTAHAPSGATAKPRRLRTSLFGASAAADVILPGADFAAPARMPQQAGGRANRREPIDPVVAALNRPRTVARTMTPIAAFHRALASPIAKLFGVLGFAPGQLSIQSLTVTVLGVATMADGLFVHVLAGAAMVYAGLLLDRADLLLAERKGAPGPWTLFLGVVVDRLVELTILVGLGILAVRGLHHPLAPWVVLPVYWLPIVAVAVAATWLVRRAVEQTAETLLLRTHLLTTRRLPGPMAVARHGPIRPFIASIAGRDEMVTVAAVGLALGQLALTLIVVLCAQAIALVEAVVVFHLRLREPEAEASRVLGPDYP
ncbi:MAG: hypothetical protein V4510_13305 [bacterium]